MRHIDKTRCCICTQTNPAQFEHWRNHVEPLLVGDNTPTHKYHTQQMSGFLSPFIISEGDLAAIFFIIMVFATPAGLRQLTGPDKDNAPADYFSFPL